MAEVNVTPRLCPGVRDPGTGTSPGPAAGPLGEPDHARRTAVFSEMLLSHF